MEYKINELEGSFGYRREGDGRVVYLFNAEVDYDAIEQVTDNVYTETTEDEDGEEVVDFSEYEPSFLDSDMAGNIEDELSMTEIADKIKGDADNTEKFELFLKQDVLDRGIPVIFVDAESKTISQIELNDLHRIVGLYKNRLIIFIREYDHVHDY
jgi:hypothetical protein